MQIESIHVGMPVMLMTPEVIEANFGFTLTDMRNGADVGNFKMSSMMREMLGGVFRVEDVNLAMNGVRMRGYWFDAEIILPLPEDFRGYHGFNAGDAVVFRYREDIECDPDEIWYVDGMACLGGKRATISGMKHYDRDLAQVWLDPDETDETDLGSWSFNTAMLEHAEAVPVEIAPEVWSGIAFAR